MNELSPTVITVVIATYNRNDLLSDLLDNLAEQELPEPWDFEVIVVDDGSRIPAGPALSHHPLGARLTITAQINAGPAAARHRAIGLSRGSIVVSLDDDMAVEPDFLARHLARHLAGGEVVLGRIDDANDGMSRPLFHRLHQRYLDVKMAAEPGSPATGVELFTGNVSFRASRYHEVGGFDVTLRRCEDRDLGVRFEQAGCRIVVAPDAPARHLSDHEEASAWRRRSAEWGALDQGIADRRGRGASSPWQVLNRMPTAFAPAALAAALAPSVGEPLAGAAYRLGLLLDKAGRTNWALQAAAITYGVDYFRGVGSGSASRRAVIRAALASRRAGSTSPSLLTPSPPAQSPWKRFTHDVAADHETSRHYRSHYHATTVSPWKLPLDALTKVGFQMLVAARFMRLLGDLKIPMGPQLVSRMIRHLYSAEIHWDAQLAPGIAIVHGNGLVISADARVGERCILFQHVTLGRSLDGTTGVSGAPHLGANVHVGPGAVLLGPISIGERSKIMGNTVVTIDIPAGTVVRPAPIELSTPRLLHAVDAIESPPLWPVAHASGPTDQRAPRTEVGR